MIILGQLLHHRSRLCAGVTREHVLPPDPVIQTISCPHHVSPISAKHNSSDTRTENILTLNMIHFNSSTSFNICRQNSSCALALKATSITTTYYQIQIHNIIEDTFFYHLLFRNCDVNIWLIKKLETLQHRLSLQSLTDSYSLQSVVENIFIRSFEYQPHKPWKSLWKSFQKCCLFWWSDKWDT